MTKLSVNINKIATLRNARGGKNPDVLKVAEDCERFGAQGITVHPRPDERHITYLDVMGLKDLVTTEFNIEGYPDDRYLELVAKSQPAQATLVPDPPGVLTSNAGWDIISHQAFLTDIIKKLKDISGRVSLFVNPIVAQVEAAAEVGADRIEFYTEPYAVLFPTNPEKAIADYQLATNRAMELGLGINAGHDLSLENLAYLKNNLPQLDEVSIGHALICDSLYYGLENTIQMYLRKLV